MLFGRRLRRASGRSLGQILHFRSKVMVHQETGGAPTPARRRRRLVAAAATTALLSTLILGAQSVSASASTSTSAAASKSAGASAGSWLPQTPQTWPLVVSSSRTPNTEITSGLAYHTDAYQTAGGAQRATELDLDLTSKNVRLGVVESDNVLTDPADETISSMAERTGAVAGINGDFFDIYGTGRPMGMVVINGRLVKSPSPSWNQNLVVRSDGTIAIGPETYSGTLTDGAASHAITSVNTVADLSPSAAALIRVTPDLGDSETIPASTVVTGQVSATNPNAVTVTSIAQNVTDIAQLATGSEAFAATGSAASWLTSTVHVGDALTVAESISPDNDAEQALSGGAILVHDGQMAVPLVGSGDNNVDNPVNAVGVTQDGKHLISVVFDGLQPEDAAEGLTRPQIAGWMLAHGAYNAILFDSGGSAQMVARQPGETQVSVSNTPSDGHPRPVANGLFFYSTAPAAGPAVKAVANNGAPMAVLAGSTVPVSGYAVDSLGNPASDPVHLSVFPPDLATVTTGPDGTTLTASGHSSHGVLIARAGHATSSVPLDVTASLSSMSMTPTEADLNNGGTQQFAVTATTHEKEAVTLLPSSASWTVSPSDLGTVDPSTGTFTAAADGEGLATVTASAGGATASASVAVGQRADIVDPMTDTSDWSLNLTGGSKATLSLSTTQVRTPTDTGSMDVDYSIPAGSGVKQIVFSPRSTPAFPPAGETQEPEAIGIWVKGDGTGGDGTPLGLGNLTLAESYAQVNGQAVTFYPSTVTYDGWQLITANLPAGLQFPLTLDFLDLLVISPSEPLSGDVYLSDLEALFSPRPPTTPTYTALPDNPAWLQYTQQTSAFKAGGATLATLGDADLRSADPGSTGSVVVKQDGAQLAALPASQTGPLALQTLGDISDTGTLPDLTYAKSVLDGLGVPYHEAVGADETSQGADPENGNWAGVFGATHYQYTLGSADVLVADDSQKGILPSDPYQSPDDGQPQYQWLVQELSANTSPVVFIAANVAPYEPSTVQNNEFEDRWEAQMFEALASKYQATHRSVHLVLLLGQAGSFAENLLGSDGQDAPNGVPNFVVADAGVPAAAPADEGGFDNYALFHVLPNGTVQFAVQPTLQSIAVSAPAATLPVGQQLQLTGTGTMPTGDDQTAQQVPIAAPASHAWASSAPAIASVDPATGVVRAHRPGTVTISLEADGVTGSTTLTVTRP
jgi:exopolysaccharide biosynthesis protein/uncharacterized protein YjdB